MELARTQGDEIVLKGGDHVGNSSRLNVRSKEYSVKTMKVALKRAQKSTIGKKKVH